MSSPQLKKAVSMLLNDHVPTYYGGQVECLCGEVFPYHSRWATHASDVLVNSVFGGDL